MEDYYLTVKDLKEKIKDLPDDTKVYYEHIEDSYIWKRGWKPIEIIHKEYPDDDYTSSYCHRAFCAYVDKYKDENILVLTAHY